MARVSTLLLFTAALINYAYTQTPVIGGSCKVGTADVQIGGKQTQFFLKCEATAESTNGEGVWVVKSRSAASPTAAPTTSAPAENTQPQQRPPMFKYNPNICEQDNGAREGDSCTVSATCLQANLDNPTTFLQCEQASQRWIKKSCQDTYIFNFEQQACIVPKRNPGSLHRQSTSGLVCTFSSCSNSNPCSSGTCNNGYCCSSGSSAPQIIVAQPSSSCNGCQQAPQIISIPVCPGGGSSLGSCGSTGFCATGYQCVQGSCCPSYNQPSISVLSCPGGGQAVGSCISGGCATGYSCSSNNQCCPTTNPFVCNDGTQAAGGCVNGQCGTGYTCSNGLCCASTSSSPKCLDGTAAVGACIPSCTGNGCGGTTLSYYCGSGYTCTTGNICCPTQSCPDGGEPIGPTVNGLCPTGYTAQGNQCCSVVATCLTGEENIGLPINEFCPAGSTLRGTVCCRAALVFAADCIPTVQLANAGCDAAGDACGAGGTVQLGYACRDVDSSLVCCPLVDYTDTSCIIGPVILDSCPIDYTAVFVNGENQCVALSCISGLCDASEQSGPCVSDECPTGYTCNVYAGVCCSDSSTALMRMSRLKTKPTIVMPPRSIFSRPAPQACPSGDEPVSACINGLCGAGLECFNNKLCCPAGTNPSFGSRENLHSLLSAVATQKPKRLCPNGEEALSSCFPDGSCGEDLICLGGVCCGTPGLQFSQAKHRNTSIGTSCSSSQQCAGFTEGLSKCERRVCRCTSIAYAKGIACVRKKMLMFNDEPMPVDSNSVIAAAPPS